MNQFKVKLQLICHLQDFVYLSLWIRLAIKEKGIWNDIFTRQLEISSDEIPQSTCCQKRNNPWIHPLKSFFAPKNGTNLWHNLLQMIFHNPFAAKTETFFEFTPWNHFCPQNGSNLWHNFLQMSFRGPLSARRKTHSHVIGDFNHTSYLTCLLHSSISMPTTATWENCKKKS